MRHRRSPEELVEVCEHLGYEYVMLRSTAQLAPLSKPVNDINILARNSFIEAFAIHVRNLYLFYWPTDKSLRTPTDLVASDFHVSQDELRRLADFKTDLLERSYNQACKQVAHLTYLRFSDKDKAGKQWSFAEIVADFDAATKYFLSCVSDTCLNEQMQSIKSQLLTK